MKNVTRARRALLNDPFMWANLSPKSTGLSLVVWIAGFWPWKGMSAPRVKVARSRKARWSDLILVAIRPDVRVVGRGTLSASDLAQLRRWVGLNRDVIIRYWDGDIEYTQDALDALKSI
jgi:hypothetical protein